MKIGRWAPIPNFIYLSPLLRMFLRNNAVQFVNFKVGVFPFDNILYSMRFLILSVQKELIVNSVLMENVSIWKGVAACDTFLQII